MNVAIILAGGSGDRMGHTTVPKQFMNVHDKPVIVYTLEAFNYHPEIDKIIVVCKSEFVEDLNGIIRRHGIKKVAGVVLAGDTRQRSSFAGLEAVKGIVEGSDGEIPENTVVLVHDGVRPLVTERIITDNIVAAREYGAVDTVIALEDTIVRCLDGAFIESIPMRSEMYAAQTPQSFRYEVLMDAHMNALRKGTENATEDCRLVLNNGGRVRIVRGDKLNFKITTQEDLMLMKAIVANIR